MNDENSNTNDNTLLANVFQHNKIKSIFLSDERIGKVSSDAIDLIGKEKKTNYVLMNIHTTY